MSSAVARNDGCSMTLARRHSQQYRLEHSAIWSNVPLQQSLQHISSNPVGMSLELLPCSSVCCYIGADSVKPGQWLK